MTEDNYHYPCTIQSISVLFTKESGQIYQQLMQSLQNCFCFLMYQITSKSFKQFWSYLQPINSDQYGFDCDVLSSPTNDTMHKNGAAYTPVFNYGPTDVGLAVNNENNGIGFDLIAALTTPTVATIMVNENENEIMFNNGLERTQTQTKTQGHHSIALGIDIYDRISSSGVELVEFNDIGCTFNVNIDRNGFDNNTTLAFKTTGAESTAALSSSLVVFNETLDNGLANVDDTTTSDIIALNKYLAVDENKVNIGNISCDSSYLTNNRIRTTSKSSRIDKILEFNDETSIQARDATILRGTTSLHYDTACLTGDLTHISTNKDQIQLIQCQNQQIILVLFAFLTIVRRYSLYESEATAGVIMNTSDVGVLSNSYGESSIQKWFDWKCKKNFVTESGGNGIVNTNDDVYSEILILKRYDW